MFNKSKPTNDDTVTTTQTVVEATPDVKPTKPAAQPSNSAAASIISAALKVTGNLDCAGDIEVKGTIDGDVKARNVRIDESGKVKGKIVAESAYIDGGVRGQIVAKVVALASSANVRGDILHETLSIEAGAFLDGNCRRLNEGDKALAAQPVKEQVAQPEKEKREPVKPIASAPAAQAG